MWLWLLLYYWCLANCLTFAWQSLWGFCLLSGLALGGSHVIAKNHHAKQGSSYLSEPSEASEKHEGTGDESQEAHARYPAIAKVAEEIAYAVQKIAT